MKLHKGSDMKKRGQKVIAGRLAQLLVKRLTKART